MHKFRTLPTGKHAFDLITPVGLYCLTARAALRLISPYCPILALNRMEFPEGSSCHQWNPIRYIVRGASHPVISATIARPRRRLAGTRQVHVYYNSIAEKIVSIQQHTHTITRLRVAANVANHRQFKAPFAL